MDTDNLLTSPIVMRMGWTLLHSLWEGAAICALAWVVLRFLRRASAASRYTAAFVGMLLMAAVPLATFIALPAPTRQGAQLRADAAPVAAVVDAADEDPETVARLSSPVPAAQTGGTRVPRGSIARAVPPIPDSAAQSSGIFQRHRIERILSYAVPVWLIGVVLLSLWRLGGWMLLQRLRVVGAFPAALEARQTMERIAGRLGIARVAQLVATTRLDAPVVLGFFKPVILFPPALLAGLSTSQLESILAHELAHIRRHDYVALLLQTAVETLLFYHPGVWWLTRQINLEREQCCDDIAAAVSGDRRGYAGALVQIEAIRMMAPALAATGSGTGELIQRIAHLLGVEAPFATRRARVAGAAVLVSTTLLAAVTFALAAVQLPSAPAASAIPATQPTFMATQPGTASAPAQTKPAADLTVSLKEFATGRPVPDALVKIRGTNFNAEEVTDPAGTARLPRQDKAEWLEVAVSGQDWVSMHTVWRLSVEEPALPETFNFIMEKATTIGGTVVDEKGAPLPDAKVMLLVNKKYPGSSQAVNVVDREISANDDGQWTFAGVPAIVDSIELAAAHPECLKEYGFYALKAFEDLPALRAGKAKLILTRGVPIDILVRGPDGQPLGDATVGYGEDRVASNVISEFLVHRDGTLRLGVPAGFEAVITVRAAGFAPELKRVKAGPTPTKVIFDMQRPQTLSGRIVDRAGHPVPGATVYLDTWREARTLGDEDIPADAEGRFTWAGAPADEVKVDVLAPGFAISRRVSVKAGALNLVTLSPPTRFVGTVADAATGKPVTGFRVIDGIDNRNGQPPSWHGAGISTVKLAGDGLFTLAFDEPYPAMIVRVEADGYIPADSTSIPLDGKTAAFTFKLQKGAMIEGTLQGAGGKPVPNADVFLAVKGQRIEIVDEGLIDQRELQRAKTDAAGHFKFVPQKDPYAMAALTADGFALATQADFEKAHTLALKPWARLEGDLRLGTHPAAGAPVSINMSPPPPFNDYSPDHTPDVMVMAYTRLTTDTAGHFAAARVMPGSVQVERDTPHNGPYTWSNGSAIMVEAKAGQTARVTVGGIGRPVAGRVSLPKEFRPNGAEPRDTVSLEWLPDPPDWSPPAEVMEMDGAQRQVWQKQWNASEEGQRIVKARDAANLLEVLRSQSCPLNPDGSFRFDEAAPGHYMAIVTLPGPEGSLRTAGMMAMKEVNIAPIPTGVTDEPLDVGVLTPEPIAPPAVGDLVPAFIIPGIDGKPVSLGDFKGKYLLIHVWRTEFKTFLPELSALTPVWDAYKNDSRLAMLGISYDRTPLPARTYAAAKAIPWPQALAIGRSTRLPAIFPMREQSVAWLIGPDGKVVAANLRGNQIRAAVEKALQP